MKFRRHSKVSLRCFCEIHLSLNGSKLYPFELFQFQVPFVQPLRVATCPQLASNWPATDRVHYSLNELSLMTFLLLKMFEISIWLRFVRVQLCTQRFLCTIDCSCTVQNGVKKKEIFCAQQNSLSKLS